MLGITLLLLCWSSILKVTSPWTITQTPGLVGLTEGGTVTLKCHLENIFVKHCYLVTWRKIHPRTRELEKVSPQVILESDQRSEEGRVSMCALKIPNASVSDCGTYYCFVSQNSLTYDGNGSTVIITEDRTSLPTIQLLSPSDDDNHKSSVPLLCLVSGVVPSQVRVYWLIDKREESGLTMSVWLNDAAAESTQNHILVGAGEWLGGVQCTCVAEFGGHNITKTVQHNVSNITYTMLLYVTSGLALLIIVVTIVIAVYLHAVVRTGEKGLERPTTVVHYATLDQTQLGRSTNVRQSDL